VLFQDTDGPGQTLDANREVVFAARAAPVTAFKAPNLDFLFDQFYQVIHLYT
jgi:hypothetical protein